MGSGSTKDALFAETMPDMAASEEARYFRVGQTMRGMDGQKIEITRITVQEDVPGLHCNTRRVCIWAGPVLYGEFPYAAAGFIGYV